MHITRREALRRFSATAATILIAHESLGEPTSTQPMVNEPLIRAIRLRTATPLDEMRGFYRDKIGFRVLDQTDREITFAAGTSTLTFTSISRDELHGDGGRGAGEPMYHFAFNVPQHKLRAAREWQLKRTPLVPPRANLVDSDFPEDIWHFRHWNAHSVFFFDPAFNIVEYIARHTLHDRTPRDDDPEFSIDDILYISEIGYVFDDACSAQAARTLHDRFGLNEYPRKTEPWWAMGDERGLILCLPRMNQLWGDNTATPVKWDVFPTECTIRSSADASFAFDASPYRITSHK